MYGYVYVCAEVSSQFGEPSLRPANANRLDPRFEAWDSHSSQTSNAKLEKLALCRRRRGRGRARNFLGEISGRFADQVKCHQRIDMRHRSFLLRKTCDQPKNIGKYRKVCIRCRPDNCNLAAFYTSYRIVDLSLDLLTSAGPGDGKNHVFPKLTNRRISSRINFSDRNRRYRFRQ